MIKFKNNKTKFIYTKSAGYINISCIVRFYIDIYAEIASGLNEDRKELSRLIHDIDNFINLHELSDDEIIELNKELNK